MRGSSLRPGTVQAPVSPNLSMASIGSPINESEGLNQGPLGSWTIKYISMRRGRDHHPYSVARACSTCAASSTTGMSISRPELLGQRQ